MTRVLRGKPRLPHSVCVQALHKHSINFIRNLDDWRVCIDYRKLNSMTASQHRRMPRPVIWKNVLFSPGFRLGALAIACGLVLRFVRWWYILVCCVKAGIVAAMSSSFYLLALLSGGIKVFVLPLIGYRPNKAETIF